MCSNGMLKLLKPLKSLWQAKAIIATLAKSFIKSESEKNRMKIWKNVFASFLIRLCHSCHSCIKLASPRIWASTSRSNTQAIQRPYARFLGNAARAPRASNPFRGNQKDFHENQWDFHISQGSSESKMYISAGCWRHHVENTKQHQPTSCMISFLQLLGFP